VSAPALSALRPIAPTDPTAPLVLPSRSAPTAWQVYKFGGSSLGTPGRLPQVLRLIAAADSAGLVVVVSALGDTTDWLVAATEAAAAGNGAQARRELQRVRSLALEIAALVLSPRGLGKFIGLLSAQLAPVARLLEERACWAHVSPADRDHILSAGEPIAAALVAAALVERAVAAIAVDARDFLTTDESFGSAAADWPETAARFASVRTGWGHALPIVTGFIGRTRDGRTTTLGRNGSDYTATLLAALLPARQVTVWTDVPGVMTADPALVPEATPVDRLSYDEALELAYFGSRMFHPRTVIPLRDAGAELCIRSTMHPEAPGTRIDASGHPDRPTCVTSVEHLALLGVSCRQTGTGSPLAGRIVPQLSAAGIRVWLAVESALGPSLSLLLPRDAAPRATDLVRTALAPELHSGELVLDPSCAPVTLITLCAGAMGPQPDLASRFLGAVGRAGIVVRAVAQGGTQRSVSCVVAAADTAAAVRAVHTAFHLTPA
jgi:aspartokinase/homoserine dehydrogenase 1